MKVTLDDTELQEPQQENTDTTKMVENTHKDTHGLHQAHSIRCGSIYTYIYIYIPYSPALFRGGSDIHNVT